MSREHSHVVEAIRSIDFTEALALLQAALEQNVKVTINDPDRFLGCGFQGQLERVETLPPDDVAIRLVLDRGAGLFLDPSDVSTIHMRDPDSAWTALDFQVASGPAITVEVPEDARSAISVDQKCPAD